MDTSRLTLIVATFAAAFLVAAVSPSPADALHMNIYQATMAPPTFSSAHPAQLAYLSCGWHVGDCYNNQDGNALDWGYNNNSQTDKTVRFRGWLLQGTSGSPYNQLRLHVFQQRIGSTLCDEAVADVVEIATGGVRYGMHYLHTNNTVSGNVELFVSNQGFGAWNNRNVATMINDTGCQGWQTGHFNAHTWLIGVSLNSYVENRPNQFPADNWYQCCIYPGNTLFPNNQEGYQTHRVQFWKGH